MGHLMAGESQAVPGSAPDPTVLTTEQLLREISTLSDLFDAKLKASNDLCEEKFQSVADKLTSAEDARKEQKADTKAAVDAALTAQKEAVKEQTAATDKAIGKTEVAVGEQLKQMSATFTTEIGNLKDRVGKIENIKLGGQESKAGLYAAAAFVASLIVVGIAVVGFVAAGSP